jgi:D-alanine transaminase
MFTIHNSYPNLNEKENGLKAKIVEDIRWKRCDIKTTSLIANILLNDEALSSDYQTAILVRDGLILEGSASNIFIVTKNGLIKTPPLSQLLCLPGITRQVTLELVNALNWECLEGDIEVSELFDAQEIWLTSTTKEIFPIIQIDESLINKGTVGNYWRAINQSYLNLIKIKK